MQLQVRLAGPADLDALVDMRLTLWPDGTREEHDEEVRATVSGNPRSTLALAILVAEAQGELVGFVEVGLRSHADGCDPTRHVGFIEGWYVSRQHRRMGVGRALVRGAEAWCREHGCAEVASDTWLDAVESQRAHEALGFQLVDRSVHYRKTLR